jgi:hypothetical protein
MYTSWLHPIKINHCYKLESNRQFVCTLKHETNDEGAHAFTDFDFDLTHSGLEILRIEKLEVYAMRVASKTYLMQQEGMPMHKQSVKPCQIPHPLARVFTTTAMLNVTVQKDNVKDVKIVKKNATLWLKGEELGTAVIVDGKDVVEELCENLYYTVTKVYRIGSLSLVRIPYY